MKIRAIVTKTLTYIEHWRFYPDKRPGRGWSFIDGVPIFTRRITK